MDVDRNAELRDRAGWQWSTALRPRLEGPGRACGAAEGPSAIARRRRRSRTSTAS